MDTNTDTKTKKTDYISLKNKEYRKNNKELISCLQKKWYDDNKDKVKKKTNCLDKTIQIELNVIYVIV